MSAGLGVAILPEGYIMPEHKIVSRRFSNVDLTRQVGIAYDGKKKVPEALQMIIQSDLLKMTPRSAIA